MFKSSVLSKFFSPILPLLFFCFLSITTLHQKNEHLSQIHLEFSTLVIFLLLEGLYFVDKKELSLTLNHPLLLPLMLALFYAIAPLLSSIASGKELSILNNDEYKTFFSILLFSPGLYYFMRKNQYKELLLNAILVFFTILALIFLYRYLVLHEVRDFDQRPLINIRNGDPNFMCAFFTMMIPLSLMNIWTCYELKKPILTLFSLFQTGLFLVSSFMTESRMGLIALIIGLIFLIKKFPLKINKGALIILVIMALSLFVFIGGERLTNRFAEMEDKSNVDRVLTYYNGVKLFVNNPLFGVGMHKAKDFFYQNAGFPAFQTNFYPLEVHNTFLKLASELGIIGLSAFSFIYFWCLKNCLRAKSPRKYFLLSSFIIFTFSSMTIPIAYKDLIIMHFYVLSALAV